jgi:myo-inositol-1(or 4)-monophosphatase
MASELTEIAVKSVLKAGEALRRGFGTSYKISSKEGRNNLVTEYDHISEKIIIDIIKEKYPDHSFLAEESGITGTNLKDRINWIIDPLDGTVNFAHNIPLFSISIAAELNGELLVGVVYHPMLDELFIAENGAGTTLNGRKLEVSRTDDHLSSILVTGFPYNVSANPSHCIEHFVSIVQKGIPVRRLGSAALDLAYVAAGRFDGFWEIDLHPWDVAAGVLLVREAGGNVTQYNKEPYSVRDKSILATNGLIHDQIAQILSDYKLLPEQNVS